MTLFQTIGTFVTKQYKLVRQSKANDAQLLG